MLPSAQLNVKYTTVWEPQEGPQTWLLTCPVFEVLFGGARGGGKSDGVLGEFASHADQYGENAIGLCVRRERTQLTELIERSKVIYAPLGATFHEQDKMWRFPNGARLRFAYLESDNDALSYQGHSYTRVYVEEMGTFPNPDPIFKLMATLRSGAGVPCRFIATANPGGPGHLWIKKRYIDPNPMGMQIIPTLFKNPFTGEKITKERVFIPSRVTDNKYTNNADYIGSLYLAGNEELVKAWLLGDWNVTLGAFFSEWNITKHVIKEFTPPKHWSRFMSMDWGSASPFSIGWWCVVPSHIDSHLDIPTYDIGNKRILLPKGSIIRYREWYGCQANVVPDPAVTASQNLYNIGLKMTAEEVAAGINLREREEPRSDSGQPRMNYRVADPKMFAQDGGPSHAERMSGAPYRVSLIRADNKRTKNNGAMGGWDQVRARLKGDGTKPTMYFMDCCKDAIRTLPAMQHDPDNLEDVDGSGEDHAPDEIRYACMSRPYSRPTQADELREMIRKKDNGIVLHDIMDDFSSLARGNMHQQRIN